MAKENNLGDLLEGIANAIQTKGGTTAPINAQNFEKAILDLPSGGGVDLTPLGISDEIENLYNKKIDDSINYGLKIRNEWQDVVSKSFLSDLQLVFFPNLEGRMTNLNNCRSMFYTCKNLEVMPYLNTENCQDFNGVFYGCESLLFPPKQLNLSKAVQTTNMFALCKKIRYIPVMDLSNVTNTSTMFSSCEQLTKTPMLNLQSCTKAVGMFVDCVNLKKININNVGNIQDTSQMFMNCYKLTTLEDANFNGITNAVNMFKDCQLLTTPIYIDTKNTTNMLYTFRRCNALKKITLTTFDKVTNTDAFSYCDALEELTLTKWKQGNILIAQSQNLTPLSIHNIIATALTKEEGATQRTLTLHATAKENWRAAYHDDEAMAAEKLITIA